MKFENFQKSWLVACTLNTSNINFMYLCGQHSGSWATRHQCREPGEVKQNENTGKTFNWNTSLLERPQFHEGLGVSLQCSSTGLGRNVKLLEDNYDLHQRSLLEISSSRAQLQWWYDHDWFKVMHGTQTCINYLMIPNSADISEVPMSTACQINMNVARK